MKNYYLQQAFFFTKHRHFLKKIYFVKKLSATHHGEISNACFNYLAVYFLCIFPDFKETVRARVERIVCSAHTHKTQIL